MANKLVSSHQLRVLDALESNGEGWMTSSAIASTAEVALRTANAHLAFFVASGIAQRLESFPGYLYSISPIVEKHLGDRMQEEGCRALLRGR
jgi:hypothetical protein